jgi:hypothetical protein
MVMRLTRLSAESLERIVRAVIEQPEVAREQLARLAA